MGQHLYIQPFTPFTFPGCSASVVDNLLESVTKQVNFELHLKYSIQNLFTSSYMSESRIHVGMHFVGRVLGRVSLHDITKAACSKNRRTSQRGLSATYTQETEWQQG